ncbi:helix-turn-helix domain-containing protein [Caulobacter sp.]|jgi:hypothetical protein|uniref:helix-turn-helix domain-containing protein n=1 Tax=Caulobacter sp. TaxID=78 RepID=UPI00161B6D6B
MTAAKPSALPAEIDRVRRSGALGRSTLLLRLFDYLAEHAGAERSPKESEVAVAVFGRRPDFDPTHDAVARVYVHKLRKRLESAPAFEGAPIALTIPRGEYRLALAAPVERAKPRGKRLAPALAALALLTLGAPLAWAGGSWLMSSGEPAALGPWQALADSQRPTLIVVGDYYIFGEYREGQPDRLVREYGVESATDLARAAARQPDRRERYFDLGLTYVPVGAAKAIAQVAPLLGPQAPRTVTASQLTPAMIKENNLVYIGYLSGLGPLKEAVFSGSRFEVGQTYDELVDRKTGRRYASQAMEAIENKGMYEDYGYVGSFAGPAGGRIVIIAGTRDAALSQVAETVTSRDGLRQLAGKAAGAPAFEALYVIDGLDQLNVDGRLLVAAPRDQAAIWGAGGRGAHFPVG